MVGAAELLLVVAAAVAAIAQTQAPVWCLYKENCVTEAAVVMWYTEASADSTSSDRLICLCVRVSAFCLLRDVGALV